MAEEHRRSVDRLLRYAVTAPSERDGQKSVGPSEIADSCDYCLGMALTRKYPEFRPHEVEPANGFSLKAWNGTAVHRQLEEGIVWAVAANPYVTDYVVEQTVPVTELDGYGDISGHVDLRVHMAGYCVVIDHKTTDLDKLKNIRMNGVPQRYAAQLQLYAHGLRSIGVDVDDVALHFIPRDSNRAEDIYTVYSRVVPAAAHRILERLSQVWDTVRTGKLLSLESEDDCFVCTRIYRRG